MPAADLFLPSAERGAILRTMAQTPHGSSIYAFEETIPAAIGDLAAQLLTTDGPEEQHAIRMRIHSLLNYVAPVTPEAVAHGFRLGIRAVAPLVEIADLILEAGRMTDRTRHGAGRIFDGLLDPSEDVLPAGTDEDLSRWFRREFRAWLDGSDAPGWTDRPADPDDGGPGRTPP